VFARLDQRQITPGKPDLSIGALRDMSDILLELVVAAEIGRIDARRTKAEAMPQNRAQERIPAARISG